MPVKVKAKAVKQTIVSDRKGLSTLIESIAKTSNKLGDMIHRACIGIVLHALDPANNKNVDLASRLIDKLGGVEFPVSRTNAIIAWFEEYGAMKWNAQKQTFSIRGAVFDNLVDEFNDDASAVIERLQSITPFKFSKQPVYAGFDLATALQALIDKAVSLSKDDEKKQKAAANKDASWNFEGLDKLVAFGAEFQASLDNRPKKGKEESRTLN